jgi:hypothetical protein
MGLRACNSHSYSVGGLRRGQIAFRLLITAGSACRYLAVCRHIRRYASKCFTIRHCRRHNSQFWRRASSYTPSNHQPGCTHPGCFPDSGGLAELLQGNSCLYINVRYRALTCPDSSRIKQPRRNSNRVTTGGLVFRRARFPGRASQRHPPADG